VFYQYLTYAKQLEAKLGIGVLSSVRTTVEHSKITLRRIFFLMYLLVVSLWVVLGLVAFL
jgi:hypothetical protein